MIPIRDDNPQFLTPYATYGLIALNVLVWVLVQGFGSQPQLAQSICSLGLIPADLLGTAIDEPRPLLMRGVPCAQDGSNWITVFSSMFMHGNWLHIIGNMWFLWIFGNNVEDAMGTVRFVIFYLLCGLAAAALQIFTDVESIVPMVGASGAIGGVMGAYVILYPRVRVHMLFFFGFFVTTIAVPAFWMLGYWLLVQLLSGVGTLGSEGGGVAFWAHIGGFAAGALLILLFRDRRLLHKHPYYGWNRKSPGRSWRRIDRR